MNDLLKVREVVQAHKDRQGSSVVEQHIAECPRCAAGFLCPEGDALIEETL